jgi:hypothetical protein
MALPVLICTHGISGSNPVRSTSLSPFASLELFQFEKFVSKGRIDQSRLQGFRFLALALDFSIQLILVFIVVGQSRVDLG